MARRLDALRRRAALRDGLQHGHAARRVDELLNWPPGRPCPSGRLREAWVAYRHGLDAVVQGGSAAAGSRSSAVERRAQHALELYEQFAAHRPPDWPGSGPAALLALARQGRAASFAGDVARLLVLGKQMRAIALEGDPRLLRQSRARAKRRAVAPRGRLPYRRSEPRRWATPEQRRREVRDRILLTGGDPALWPNAALAGEGLAITAPALTGSDPFDALDGGTARATRYRAELAARRFELPPTWADIPHTTRPQEGSRR